MFFYDPAYPWLKNGLVGHWCPSLTGPTGTDLLDLSGWNNKGALSNMNVATSWVDSGGKLALDFDGVFKWIEAPLITPSMAQLTLSCWAMLRSTGGQGTGFSRLFARANFSEFAFSYQSSGLAVAINGTTVGIFSYTAPATSFVHFCATWDGATVRVFTNGSQLGSAAYSGTLSASTTVISLGGVNSLQRTIDGLIDDWRIFNRALTQSEIQDLYIGGRGFGVSRRPTSLPYKRKWWNLTKNPLYRPAQPINRGKKSGLAFYDPDTSWTRKDLIGHWCPSLTGPTGTNLVDLSGQNNTMTTNISPSTDWVDSGGKAAINFQIFKYGIASNLPVFSPTRFSLSTWVYVDPSINRVGWIISVPGTSSNLVPGIDIREIPALKARFANASSSIDIATGRDVRGKWTLLTSVYEAPNCYIYIDSILAGSGVLSDSSGLNLSAREINLARFGTGGNYSEGQLDDIRIYNRVLTPEEIQKLYIGGRGYGVSRKPNSKWWSIDSNYKPTTKKKRGSLINLNIPGRTWISEPEGKSFISKGERLSTGGLAYDNKDLKSLYPYNTGKKVGPIYYNPKMPWVSNGLVGHWCPSLTGPTGTDLFDLSGQNNKGALTNMDAATDWVDSGGKLALDFDGVNDWVNVQTIPTGMTEITVLYWLNVNTTTLALQAYKTSSDVDMFYANIVGTGTPRFFFGNGKVGGSGGYYYFTSTTPINYGSWNCISATYSTNSSTARLFINGVSVGFTTTGPGGFSTLGEPTTPLYIGRSPTSGQYFTGQLDDIRIYNRALSPQEIQDLYIGGRGFGASNKPYKKLNSVPPAKKKLNKSRIDRKRPVSLVFPDHNNEWVTNGLVGHWCPSLTGPTGTQLLDLSGQNNAGTLTNMDAATDWVDSGGKLALDFDGVDDYVATNLSCSNRSNLDISAWIFRASTSNNAFVGAGEGTSGGPRANIYISGQTTYVTAEATGYGYASVANSRTGWNHYHYSFRGSGVNNSDRLKLFINGVEAVLSYSGVLATTLGNVGFFEIGRTKGEGLYATAQIDDVRIYNRALTPQEIQKLYIGGRGFGFSRKPNRSPALFSENIYTQTNRSLVFPG